MSFNNDKYSYSSLIAQYKLNEELFDYNLNTFCNIPFNHCDKIDFRTKIGKKVRTQCSSISLANLKKVCILVYTATIPATGIVVHISKQKIDLLTLSKPSPKLSGIIHGWWVRNQIKQKGKLFYTSFRWSNDLDPVSLESVSNIPNMYIFLLDTFMFDIRQLSQLIDRNISHPFLNIPFTSLQKQNIQKRWKRLLNMGYKNTQTPISEKNMSNDQRALTIFQKIDRLGYVTDISWYTNMSVPDLRKWYINAEDIWNYRAELTSQVKHAIVPNVTPLFKYIHEMKSSTSIDENAIHKYVLDAMDNLVSKASKIEDQSLGAMYILTALTEVSQGARETMPWLYQPPNIN